MEDYSQLKENLQTIINEIQQTLEQLKQEQIIDSDILLTNSKLNNNINTFSFTSKENDTLILLTENIENILRTILSSIDEKSQKYLFNLLHEYHYDSEEKKFLNPIQINDLHAFLNHLQSLQALLDAFPAAWNGTLFVVREFIKNYPQFKDKPGIWGTTLLYSAARNNKLELVKYLIETARCSINAQNQQHVEKILTNQIVTASDYVQAPTAGSTALHGACFYDQLEIVKYLVEHGADYYITNHTKETAIKNATVNKRIEDFFREYLILGYSIKTDTLPERPIIEGGQKLIKDCIWEYKPLSTDQWYSFSSNEATELSSSLIVQSNEQFQEEIHLKVRAGVYSVSMIKFLRSGKGLDHKQNLAWIRCRGSSILNFDCYSIWQMMFIQYPTMDSKILSSLEIFQIPSIIDSNFVLQINAWYNCTHQINFKFDKTINYRKKILRLKLSFINDQLEFNFQTFQFSNKSQTILGFIRWIPKFISADGLNNNKIIHIDNFKSTVDLNPIPMTSAIHQKLITDNDQNISTGDEEHENFHSFDENQLDNYDENLLTTNQTSTEIINNTGWSMNEVANENEINNNSFSSSGMIDIEENTQLEDYVNETNAITNSNDLPKMTHETDSKLQETTTKMDNLQEENEILVAQIQILTMSDEIKNEKHEPEIVELFEKINQIEIDRKKLQDEQNQLKQIHKTIRTIHYENIKIELIDQFLIPNLNLIINSLKICSSIKFHQYLFDNLPKIEFQKYHNNNYLIILTGFQEHHDQFRNIFLRIQSLFQSIQSAKDFYQRELNRNKKSIMQIFVQVSSKARFWILYKQLFLKIFEEQIQEYLNLFNDFLQEHIKILIEQTINEELTQSWLVIRNLTNEFMKNNFFFNQIESIKYQTLKLFIEQNISYQRIKIDKKPTEKSALVAQQMIEKLLQKFQIDPQYQGYQLKQFQLIPPLLQRINIYYSCFILQLPLFEFAIDLLGKIQNHTVTTITTSTGSGKSTLLPPLLLAEGYDKVLVTQPRRLPCQLISKRVNETMAISTNNKREDLAGWVVSGAEYNPDAQILFLTDGLLRERLLYDDNIISLNTQLNKGLVIFLDEVHERSINIDLCLAFLARLLTNQPELKSKLKIIISSATLDRSVPKLFRHIPNINLTEFNLPQMGTLYPVIKHSRPNANILDIVQELYKTCERNDQILCFVNSALEATQYCKLLSDITKGAIHARTLIQSQSPKVQYKNIEEAHVLFSTTIAETSLTFPSLKYVIDTGYINLPIFNPQLKRTILTTISAAHSTIKQRLGRVGRTKSGEYYSLYDFNVEQNPFPTPQICLTDLTNIEFSLRRSPLQCGLQIMQEFLPDKPLKQSIDYTTDTLRTLKILETAPSDRFTNFGRALAKIPDFGTLSMSISVLSALRDHNCGHDLICLSSILSALNTTATFTSIPDRFKSSDGDFMTLLNIMDEILLIKQSIPSYQFDLDRVCHAKGLLNIKHIIGSALRRYISLEKSFNLSNDYCEQAHLKSGNWENIAKALLAGYSDNVFVSLKEFQEKNHLFARSKDLTDIAMLDLKSTLTKSLKQEPVPIIIARDVLYSSAVRSRAIISFVGEIKLEWMGYHLQRELNLTAEEETYLNNENRYTRVRSLYSDHIHMRFTNQTLTLHGPSRYVIGAERQLRKEMINTLKYELKNRHTPGSTLHENLSRNLAKVSKMPKIFLPMIWRWKLEKQIDISVTPTPSKSCEITIKGRDSEIFKVKNEFDSFMSWLGNCAVLRHPDAGVSPRILRRPLRTQCLDIEERISHVTDSKRTRVDLHNGVKGRDATRETRMEVVAWIAVCKFNCKVEGGFVRDWIVGEDIQRPPNLLNNPKNWVQYQGYDQIPYMVKDIVPADLDCHLPADANFDIEKFQDELHRYDIKCKVYRQSWRYVLLLDEDETTGPFTMDLIEPHVALTHDRIDFDVSNLYLEKDYTREIGMRVDIQQKPYSIELENIVDNIKKKRFRILRSNDHTIQERIDKMVNIRHWTQFGESFPYLPSPDPQYCSVLVPLLSSSVLYKDVSTKIQNIDIGITIKSIEQIKNPLIEDAYEAMKSIIARECPGSNPNERNLFHGTKGTAIQGITDYGFDDRYFSTTGRWGHGAYFADDPKKSHGYANPDPNDQTRVIFYAKVLLGIPSVQNTDDTSLVSAPIDHHSVQGTGGPYEEYIVYRYGQALPYLKIIYK